MSIVALFLADVLTCVGATIGTLGLCAATLARLPPDSRNIRVPIATALGIGLVTMVPGALLLGYMVFTDSNAKGGILALLGYLMFFSWCFVGPIAVAIHFLVAQFRK